MIFLRFQRRDQLVTKLRAASDATKATAKDLAGTQDVHTFDPNSRNFDLKIAKQLSPSIGTHGMITCYDDTACLPGARSTPM